VALQSQIARHERVNRWSANKPQLRV